MRSAISERYPPAVIDAHAHLTDRRFATDVDDVLERARKAGIERVLTAGEDVASDLLGEVGCSDLLCFLAMVEFERLCFDLRHLFLGGYAVLDHALHNPIAASLCREREAARVVAVRGLGQTGEKGSFAERQLVEHFVDRISVPKAHPPSVGTVDRDN